MKISPHVYLYIYILGYGLNNGIVYIHISTIWYIYIYCDMIYIYFMIWYIYTYDIWYIYIWDYGLWLCMDYEPLPKWDAHSKRETGRKPRKMLWDEYIFHPCSPKYGLLLFVVAFSERAHISRLGGRPFLTTKHQKSQDLSDTMGRTDLSLLKSPGEKLENMKKCGSIYFLLRLL
jgi:hypothetical protein